MAKKKTPNARRNPTGVTYRPTVNPGTGTRTIMRGGERRITSLANGIRVRYTDPMQTIHSNQTTLMKGYSLIGTNFSNMPWLSSLAKNYSKFRINSVRVFLQSSCPTSQRGYTVIGWTPEYSDAVTWSGDTNTGTVYNFAKWVTGPCWSGSNMHGVTSLDFTVSHAELHPVLPWYYVGGSTASNFNVGGCIVHQNENNGEADNLVIGRIFLEYDIEFVQPIAPTSQSVSMVSWSGPPLDHEGPIKVPDSRANTDPSQSEDV